MPANNQVKQYSSVELHFGSRGYYWWDIKLVFDQDKLSNEAVTQRIKQIDQQLKGQFVNYAKPGVGKSFSFDPLKEI